MTEQQQMAIASEGMKQVAAGVFGSVNVWAQGRQDRHNLQADLAAVQQMRESGLTVFRYSGLSMNLETYAHNLQEEIERQVKNTVETLLKADSVIDWDKVDLAKFSPEFRHRWASEVGNISDETLQGLWARLLKGELESPGSVSNDTMSIAGDMTKERAKEFQILCSAAWYDINGTPSVVVGCGSPGQDSLAPYGLSYDVLMRLAHHRLINSAMNTVRNVRGSAKPTIVGTHRGQMWLLESSTETPSRPIEGILFTPAGEEIARVVESIAVPEYTQAMFQDLEKQGWVVRPVRQGS